MKTTSYLLALAFILSMGALKASAQINNCFINLKQAGKLKMKTADRMPEENDHTRKLMSATGDVDLTIVDGYRVLYYNSKNVPFVNLKVERSKPENYKTDQQKVLAELKYLNVQGGTKTKELIKLTYNGFEIYGLSRNRIEGSTLGSFVMFPGNDTIVYFYFNNMKPEVANFTDLADYEGQRNDFIGEYTAHLNNCLKK